jgi:exonuclease III
MAALSESRLPDIGKLEEKDSVYVFIWKGLPSSEHRQSGMGFEIRSSLVKCLDTLSTGIGDRIMSLRFPLSRHRYMTIISAYAPTLVDVTDEKEAFYDQLSSTISPVPKNDKLLLVGDFNERVRKDNSSWDLLYSRKLG